MKLTLLSPMAYGKYCTVMTPNGKEYQRVVRYSKADGLYIVLANQKYREIDMIKEDERMATKKMTFEEMENCIREHGYIKQWKALDAMYRDEKTAKKVVKMIQDDKESSEVLEYLTSIWHKIGIELSGMTKKEYFANADAPLWERDDFKWNSETEEWDMD